MKKFTSAIYVTGLALYSLATPVFGQQANFKPAEIEQKFYQTKKQSDEIKKNYSWNSRTDVTRDGKVVDILIEEFRYGTDGKLEKKLINSEEAKLPSSFLIHALAEEVKTRTVAFMTGLHTFLQSYSFNDQSQGIVFFSKAMVGPMDPSGLVMVTSEDVISKGDKIQFWIDSHNFAIIKSTISTTFEGDLIEFTATYKYLLPGLNYMAFAEVLVPDKSIMVQLHFYDYTKID